MLLKPVGAKRQDEPRVRIKAYPKRRHRRRSEVRVSGQMLLPVPSLLEKRVELVWRGGMAVFDDAIPRQSNLADEHAGEEEHDSRLEQQGDRGAEQEPPPHRSLQLAFVTAPAFPAQLLRLDLIGDGSSNPGKHPVFEGKGHPVSGVVDLAENRLGGLLRIERLTPFGAFAIDPRIDRDDIICCIEHCPDLEDCNNRQPQHVKEKNEPAGTLEAVPCPMRGVGLRGVGQVAVNSWQGSSLPGAGDPRRYRFDQARWYQAEPQSQGFALVVRPGIAAGRRARFNTILARAAEHSSRLFL